MQKTYSRSREGAWIEMLLVSTFCNLSCGRSREGAWIEINTSHLVAIQAGVAPARERGLKLMVMS